MAKIYFRKIKEGSIYLSDVPNKWKPEVEVLMSAFLATIEGQSWLVTHPNWRGE